MEKSLTSSLWMHYQDLLQNKCFKWKLISVFNDKDVCKAVFESDLPSSSRILCKTVVDSAAGWKSHIFVD